ncbi:hypothetical protein CCAX7_55220 [Capsulimonas corticalis]|uniref:Uncharacterized protein n=1 Tax=Capsulimonas corticalis TaxID=2219043 RepID=A0A402D5N9_9BACT|nr:hypothetical protein [Capsulimonas corticalis]BDI33471.1 hypothetical protein CCAX7_55220 [Capsulimonas corticalis]
MINPDFIERWAARLLKRGERWSKRKIATWATGLIASAILGPHMHRPTLKDAVLLMQQAISGPGAPLNQQTMERNNQKDIDAMNKAMQKR